MSHTALSVLTLSPDGHCEQVTRGIHISNILGYLSNTLPPLDVEGGDVSSTDNIGELPFVLRVNGGPNFIVHVCD